MSDLFQEQLQALRAQSLHRKLREIGTAQGPQIQIVGQQLANFSSNDYLGLANDPMLCEAAAAAIAEFGVGAGASRLVSSTQAALTFSSGYAAAVGTIRRSSAKKTSSSSTSFATPRSSMARSSAVQRSVFSRITTSASSIAISSGLAANDQMRVF